MSQLRLARLCLMLAAVGLSAPALTTAVHAQEKPAAEAPKDTVRPELFKLLDPAAIKPLMDAKNYAEVQNRVQQAEAFPNRTPYEDYVVNRMKLSLGSATNNNAIAMPALEAVINSGRLQGQEQADFILALGNMHYNAKDYTKAIEWFKRYQKESATPEKVTPSLIRAHYLGGDFASAKAALLPAIEATEKAGQKPSEEDLRLLASSANKVKDDAGYLTALEKLVAHYPNDDFWTDVLNRGVARKSGFDAQTNMINVYRLEAATVKKMAPEEYVDLAELARRTVGDLAGLAQAKNIDLGLQHADEASITGQPDALHILLRNLVENAVKYTPSGGTVDIALRLEKDAAVVSVEDSGPGIPPEERERVFDRFYRVAGIEAAGSGLGLAIIKAIAERHGATLKLDKSERLGGLAAVVRFPLGKA